MGNLKIVEVTGVTGSGKTSFINEVDRLSSQCDYKIAIVNEYGIYSNYSSSIHSQYFLKNINKSTSKTRSLIIDIIIIPHLFNLKSIKLILFVLQNIFLSPDKFFSKLNILRNSLKRIGLYNILNKMKPKSELDCIFLDEGILHLAHNIFINDFKKPSLKSLSEFLSKVPLYDFTMLIKADKNMLVSVLSKRRHKRVKKDRDSKNNYISNAITVFNHIESDPRLNENLIKIKRNNLKSVDDLNSLLKKILNI